MCDEEGESLFANRRRVVHSLLIALVASSLQLAALPVAMPEWTSGPGVPTSSSNGLRVAAMGSCAGGYQIGDTNLCSHGVDPIPAWVRHRGGPAVELQTAAFTAPAAVGCDGDGVSGKRVQAIYAYVSGRPNRLSTFGGSMRSWASDVDAMFRRSAQETSGTGRLRWVTADCLLDIAPVALSSVAETDFGTMLSELDGLGHNRNDRKYLIWFDSYPNISNMCGLGTIWQDDRASTDNYSNQLVGYSRIDYICWDFAESHELMHNLGGVQLSAPHSSGGWHCTDENDQMCYEDGPGLAMTYPCADIASSDIFDCGHNDYFHTSPQEGSYLSDHWNTARSDWLVGGEEPVSDHVAPTVATPRISAVPGQTVTTTSVVRVSWPEASDPSGIATYELQRRKGSGSWTNVTLSAPTATSADLSLLIGATYTFRVRARDGAGNIGLWAAAPAAAVTRLEETSAAITYLESFRRVAVVDASGGYVRKTGVGGRVARLTFSGSSVAFVSTTATGRGIATIRIDGGAWESIDLYSPTAHKRRVVWAAAVEQGVHTVEVNVTGLRNPSATRSRIDVDAFLII